jgi:hypothetical protein
LNTNVIEHHESAGGDLDLFPDPTEPAASADRPSVETAPPIVPSMPGRLPSWCARRLCRPTAAGSCFQVFKDGVWLLDVQTQTMHRILDDSTAEEFAWSPDGGRIVYHSSPRWGMEDLDDGDCILIVVLILLVVRFLRPGIVV